MDRVAGVAVIAASVIVLPWLAVSAAANIQAFPSPVGRSLNSTCTGARCGAAPNSLFTSGNGSPASFQAAFVVVAVALVVVSYVAWRRGVTGRHDSFWNIPGFVLGIGIFFGVLLLSRSLVGSSVPYDAGGAGGESLWYLTLSLIVVAGVMTAAWVLKRAGRGELLPEVQAPEEVGGAAAVLRRGLASLGRGEAPRLVIIECYRSMQDFLRKKGVEDAPSMTAREFEEAGRRVLDVGRGPVHRLTALFEKARYSDEHLDAEIAAEADSVLKELTRAVEKVSPA